MRGNCFGVLAFVVPRIVERNRKGFDLRYLPHTCCDYRTVDTTREKTTNRYVRNHLSMNCLADEAPSLPDLLIACGRTRIKAFWMKIVTWTPAPVFDFEPHSGRCFLDMLIKGPKLTVAV